MKRISLLYLTAAASLTLTGASHAATYIQEVFADSPVGWYRLGEANASSGALDSSASPVTSGVYNNFASTAFGQAGIPGAGGNTSVLFDGVNDWVQTYTNGIAGGDFTYTLEVWINIGSGTTITGNDYAVSHLRSGQTNRYHALGIDTSANAVMSQNQNSASNLFASPAVVLNDGNWHHLVGVFGTGNTSTEDLFYVDGTLVGNVNGPQEDSATSSFFIGLLHNAAGDRGYFTGRIDEAAIYNSQLSAERIQAHYLAGITPVPEMSAVLLMGVGVGTLLLFRRRGRR